jgi:hypothetical protein
MMQVGIAIKNNFKFYAFWEKFWKIYYKIKEINDEG